MKQHEAEGIATALSARLGLPLSGQYRHESSGELIELRPTDVDSHEGFAVLARLGWQSVSVEFQPGPYAKDLIRAMGQSDSEARNAFASVARAVEGDRGRVHFSVNGATVNAGDPTSWPVDWEHVELRIVRSPLDLTGASYGQPAVTLGDWAGRLLVMVLALSAAPESSTDPEIATHGLPEGAMVRVTVNRYERSRTNRAICISLLGDSCSVCGLEMGRRYGPLGVGIIHVHHVVPVSRLGAGYVIDPVRDLIPVCPNCHTMLHRVDPPFLPDQLRGMLAAHGGGPGVTAG